MSFGPNLNSCLFVYNQRVKFCVVCFFYSLSDGKNQNKNVKIQIVDAIHS